MSGDKTPIPEVNMDALSAPEGGYDPIVHGSQMHNPNPDEEIPGANGDLNGLPNLDPPAGDPNPNPGDPNPNPNPDPNPNPNPDPNPNPNPNPDPNPSGEYWMKPFEQLKAANPEWEIPKDITEENYLATLQAVLQPQKKEIHPELLKIQEALDAGVPMNQVMDEMKKSSDFNALTDRELLAASYKENYKNWDDKKIKETLDKLDNAGLLEIEGTKLRNAINQQRAQKIEAMKVVSDNQQKEVVAQMNQARAKQITESLDIINKSETVFNLPISQADKTEFAQYFSALVTPDETGNAPMFQALQSNETLVKVAYMLWKGDAKIRAALTDAKESGKNSMLNKLDPKPNTPAKGGGGGDPTKIDLDALSAPERVQWGK